LLAAFGIDPAMLPSVAAAGSVAGELTHLGADLTGLRPGIAVAVGTGDDFSSLLGSGIYAPGTVGVTLGTGEAIAALCERPVIDPDMLVETHAFPTGHFHLGNPGWLSGGAVTWFLRTFSVASASEFSALAAGVPPGSDGLLFLPALSGAMSPRWVATARGAFYGMTASHTKAHFARAVLEGTSLAMRDVIDRFDALGIATGRIRIMGGGAASRVWTQMRADLCGRPIESLEDGDTSAMGAAVLAAVAAGGAPDVRQAAARVEIPVTAVDPIAANYAVYDDCWHRYRALFDALEPMTA
jgi:xylulokinase